MNDEQIIEYLRSRSRVDAPIGLSQQVMAEVAAAPAQRSWFSGFVPAVATVGVVAVVAVVAMLVVKLPPSGGPSASPSFPVVVSDPRFGACGGPTYVDRVVAAFPFVAADYQRHFPNMGRSPELEVDQPAFAVVFAGGLQLPDLLGPISQPSPPASSSGHMVCVYVGEEPDGEPYYYVNVDITGMRAEVAAAASPTTDPTQPPTPEPTPEPTPSASPAPGYVSVEDLPITVLANAEADALFAETQRCVSKAGYAVDVPASWYTNTPTEETPACTWFAPEPFEGSIQPVAVKEHPDGIWITLEVVDGLAGYVGETPIYMREQVILQGFDGHRAEYGPSMGGVVGTPSEERGYWYVIPFANDGPTFIAETGTDLTNDYPLAKAVLDRIVARISFDR